MKPGDEVMASDFDGDIQTIGVRAIFVGMSADGKFQTRPAEPGRYKKDIVEWKYCELACDKEMR